METLQLDQLGGAALLDRTDTKFLLSQEQACDILRRLAREYRALEVNGLRLHPYRTLYFDTDDLTLYRWHHAGSVVRHKIRSRQYLQTGLAFFEVKHKTGLNRTVKDRLSTTGLVTAIDAAAERFIAQWSPGPQALSPQVLNEFSRITLVGRDAPERVTLDFGLRFSIDERSAALAGLVIAEVKQSRLDRGSPVMRELRAAGLRPRGVSKYCLGVALLRPDVKHNAFKPQLRLIAKLTKESARV